MKRGGPMHPKTLALAAALKIDRWGAVGLLECMWQWAGQYARRGDIGRHPNAAIAQGIGWSSGANDLISAMVAAGFLDACPCHRLRIHDWPDHADQGVQRTKEVVRSAFLECYEASFSLAKNSSETEPHTATATATAQGNGNGTLAKPPRSRKRPLVVPHWPTNWVGLLCEPWTARYDAPAPGGKIAGQVKRLAMVGDQPRTFDAVVGAWGVYLSRTEAMYASPAHFVDTFGEWAGTASPAQAVGKTASDRTQAALQRFEARRG